MASFLRNWVRRADENDERLFCIEEDLWELRKTIDTLEVRIEKLEKKAKKK